MTTRRCTFHKLDHDEDDFDRRHDNGRLRSICRMALREESLLRLYGVTLLRYDAMYDEQDGRCWICAKPYPRAALRLGRGPHRVLNVDHADVNGKPLPIALLCAACNKGIGIFVHSLALWERVGRYLTIRATRVNEARLAILRKTAA